MVIFRGGAFWRVVLFRGGYTRSITSAERSEAREDGVGPTATFRVASPLVMATRGTERRLGAVHSGASWVCRRCVVCASWVRRVCVVCACNSSHYLLLRKGVVPHETTSDSDIDCSGFAALRLRQRPTPTKPPISAPETIQMRFTRGEADESERKRAREAQLHQPASRERSSEVALKTRSRDAGSTPLPSAAPRRSPVLQTSVESIRRCLDQGTS
ncbi:MAG: hypothetical protein RL591_1671 [Planctomycetota bacterium]